jgi:hypothetical protein
MKRKIIVEKGAPSDIFQMETVRRKFGSKFNTIGSARQAVFVICCRMVSRQAAVTPTDPPFLQPSGVPPDMACRNRKRGGKARSLGRIGARRTLGELRLGLQYQQCFGDDEVNGG